MHLRYALRWTGQFGRAAAIAEVMETLTNNGRHCRTTYLQHISKRHADHFVARASGDAKLYYARKLLRINENECAEAHTPAQHNIP